MDVAYYVFFVISIILPVISFISYENGKMVLSRNTINLMVFSILTTFAIREFTSIIKSNIEVQYKNEIEKMKNNYEIRVDDNLKFHIYENDIEIGYMQDITEFMYDDYNHALCVKGDIEIHNESSIMYFISYFLLNLSELSNYLSLAVEHSYANGLENESLKKVFYMNTSLQKKYLIKELKEGTFILPCSLKKHDSTPLFTNNYIGLYPAQQEDYHLLYTSANDLPDKIKKEYPIYRSITLSQFINQAVELESNVFQKDKKNELQGIIINNDTECIKLNLKLIQKILYSASEGDELSWQ